MTMPTSGLTINVAQTVGGHAGMTPLETTMDDMLRTAHRQNLALRLFLGCVEGWVKSRGAISDTAMVDMIAIAAQKADEALKATAAEDAS